MPDKSLGYPADTVTEGITKALSAAQPNGTLQANLNAELLNGNNRFEYHNFKGGKIIAQGEDCNVLPIGIVWSDAGARTLTILNRPTGATGRAIIITETANGVANTLYAVQTWRSGSPIRIWQRRSDNGVWSAWIEIAFTELGTWTPRFEGSTVAGTNTYSNQSGAYTKVGKLVNITGRITLTALDSLMSGTVRIMGLPFAPASSYATMTVGSFNYITLPDGRGILSGYTDVASGSFALASSGSGVSGALLAVSALASNSHIIFSASYATA